MKTRSREMLIPLLLVAGCMSDEVEPELEVAAVGSANGEVHGFVVAEVRGTDGPAPGGRHYLPDATVFLRHSATGVTSGHTTTDLKGFYQIKAHTFGIYDLCWEGFGIVPGCRTSAIVLDGSIEAPPDIVAAVERGVILGRVLLADGEPGIFRSPYFGVSIDTKVQLLDAANRPVTQPVRANIKGDYLLRRVPNGNFTLRAESDGTSKSVPVAGGGLTTVNVTLPNKKPIVAMTYASAGGTGIRKAAPGDTVKIDVRGIDPDGDPASYRWLAGPGDGTVTDIDAPSTDWKLPAEPGLHTAYALVSDRRGGHRVSKVSISTEAVGAMFSGIVSANDVPVVDGATVRVNGVATTTNAQGYFFLEVPQAPRYVLHIKKPGYQLMSRVLWEQAIAGRYRLIRATTRTVDPTRTIDVTESRDGQDRLPARLQIPANSLVDPTGKLPTGSLQLELSSIDQRDPVGRMPGDWGARNRRGQQVGIETFGAVEINVRDAAGTRFNLAPGKTATVFLPMDSSQVSGAPGFTPVWFYDENTGLWREEGNALKSGGYMRAIVQHFSIVNADVEFTSAACMRLLVDTARLKLPFDVRVHTPVGSGPDKIVTKTVTDPINVIVRLPANQNIKVEVLDTAGIAIPLATVNQSSGAATPAGLDTALPYPYLGCSSEVLLTLDVPSDGGFLDYIGTDDATSADAYYDAIDPTDEKTTLTDWQGENGFGADDAAAVYLNAGDLGFGRSMHMKQSGSNVAYYVTNYETVDEARLDINAIATVAMEYSPGPGGGTPYTKFYVFNGAGTRVTSANLDGLGPKFIPRLCVICHGGTPGSMLPNGDMAAKFIPFDPESFKYSEFDPGFLGVFPFGRAAQEDDFKELNEGILDTDPTDAVQELVEGWYGGPALPLATHFSAFVPTGYSVPGKHALYSDVLKHSCRSCHTTRPAPIDWATWDGPDVFDGFKEYGVIIEPLVCDARVMPQARLTFRNFWLSTAPHRPSALANAGLDGWAPTDPCPVP